MIRILLLLSFSLFLGSNISATPPSIGASNAPNKTTTETSLNEENSTERSFGTKKIRKGKFLKRLLERFQDKQRFKADIAADCDRIKMKNGEEIEGKVIEIGVQNIVYKKCDWADGPDYSVSRDKVESIQYSNGSEEKITPGKAASNTNSGAVAEPENDSRKAKNAKTVSILALIFAGIGIFVPYFILPALILGIVGVVNSKRHGSRIGRKLGMAAIIISVITIILWVALIFVFLSAIVI